MIGFRRRARPSYYSGQSRRLKGGLGRCHRVVSYAPVSRLRKEPDNNILPACWKANHAAATACCWTVGHGGERPHDAVAIPVAAQRAVTTDKETKCCATPSVFVLTQRGTNTWCTLCEFHRCALPWIQFCQERQAKSSTSYRSVDLSLFPPVIPVSGKYVYSSCSRCHESYDD